MPRLFLFFANRQLPSGAPSIAQGLPASRAYSTAADALAALVDAAASAPQMEVAKSKEIKHEGSRIEENPCRRSSVVSEQQQQMEQKALEGEKRGTQGPYTSSSAQGPYTSSSTQGQYTSSSAFSSSMSQNQSSSAIYSEAGKDKAPPAISKYEEELRTRGKTTITAANFIDVIITRQIASDKDARDRGSQSSDSSSSRTFLSWATLRLLLYSANLEVKNLADVELGHFIHFILPSTKSQGS